MALGAVSTEIFSLSHHAYNLLLFTRVMIDRIKLIRLNHLLPVKEPKDFVYLLDNCPHDWLFLQCAAVVRPGVDYFVCLEWVVAGHLICTPDGKVIAAKTRTALHLPHHVFKCIGCLYRPFLEI